MTVYTASSRKYPVRRRKSFLKTRRLDLPEKIILFLMGLFFLAACVGAVIANITAASSYSHLFRFLDQFFLAFPDNAVGSQLFREALVKYSKTVFLIWVVSFVPAGGVCSVLILGVKGMSVGFTTSIFILNYGWSGFIYCLVVFFPQSLILVSTYFFVCYRSIRYIIDGLNEDKKADSYRNIVEHAMVLLAGLGCVIVASAFEGYILPSIISLVLRG